MGSARVHFLCWTLLAQCAGTQSGSEQSAPQSAVVPPPVKEEPATAVEPSFDTAAHELSADGPDSGTGVACSGAATRELAEELRMRALETKPCYEQALRENPKLAGRLVVALRVEADGSVSKPAIRQDGVGSERLARCVWQVFVRRMASPPERGCVDVMVPLNFKPKVADAGPESGP
jgi:hypothetical protein